MSRAQPPSGLAERLRALDDLPGVAAAAETVRQACTDLRFEEALRRRIPEAAAESRIRGARASAELDGADASVAELRNRVRGATPWPEPGTPIDQVLRGAVQATAETEHLLGVVRAAPLQALARLHVAAAAPLLPPDALGRPRTGAEQSREFVDLGPAPDPAIVADRLDGLIELVVAATRPGVSVLVVAALVHAEIASVRPFVLGNGLVARAMERLVIHAGGLDPTGVAVPEAGHVAAGGPAYLGSLAAYGTGTSAGLALWLQHCGEAVAEGAREGQRICAAVQRGRLG